MVSKGSSRKERVKEKARGEEISKEEAMKWHGEKKARRVIDALTKKGYDTEYFHNSEKALKKITEFASSAQNIGFGGSVTLRELNLSIHIPSPNFSLELYAKRMNFRKQAPCDRGVEALRNAGLK
jgi:hypothetical protein